MSKTTTLIDTLLLHEQELRRFLLRHLGCRQQVADLFQDLAERVLRRTPEDFANPRAYLFQAASNAVIDHRRAESCRTRHAAQCLLEEDAEVDERGPERRVLAQECVTLIETALAELPPLTRQIFYLYRLDGLSQHDIAHRLGISRSTVERRLASAISHWQSCLDRAEETKAE